MIDKIYSRSESRTQCVVKKYLRYCTEKKLLWKTDILASTQLPPSVEIKMWSVNVCSCGEMFFLLGSSHLFCAPPPLCALVAAGLLPIPTHTLSSQHTFVACYLDTLLMRPAFKPHREHFSCKHPGDSCLLLLTHVTTGFPPKQAPTLSWR